MSKPWLIIFIVCDFSLQPAKFQYDDYESYSDSLEIQQIEPHIPLTAEPLNKDDKRTNATKFKKPQVLNKEELKKYELINITRIIKPQIPNNVKSQHTSINAVNKSHEINMREFNKPKATNLEEYKKLQQTKVTQLKIPQMPGEYDNYESYADSMEIPQNPKAQEQVNREDKHPETIIATQLKIPSSPSKYDVYESYPDSLEISQKFNAQVPVGEEIMKPQKNNATKSMKPKKTIAVEPKKPKVYGFRKPTNVTQLKKPQVLQVDEVTKLQSMNATQLYKPQLPTNDELKKLQLMNVTQPKKSELLKADEPNKPQSTTVTQPDKPRLLGTNEIKGPLQINVIPQVQKPQMPSVGVQPLSPNRNDSQKPIANVILHVEKPQLPSFGVQPLSAKKPLKTYGRQFIQSAEKRGKYLELKAALRMGPACNIENAVSGCQDCKKTCAALRKPAENANCEQQDCTIEGLCKCSDYYYYDKEKGGACVPAIACREGSTTQSTTHHEYEEEEVVETEDDDEEEKQSMRLEDWKIALLALCAAGGLIVFGTLYTCMWYCCHAALKPDGSGRRWPVCCVCPED